MGRQAAAAVVASGELDTVVGKFEKERVKMVVNFRVAVVSLACKTNPSLCASVYRVYMYRVRRGGAVVINAFKLR